MYAKVGSSATTENNGFDNIRDNNRNNTRATNERPKSLLDQQLQMELQQHLRKQHSDQQLNVDKQPQQPLSPRQQKPPEPPPRPKKSEQQVQPSQQPNGSAPSHQKQQQQPQQQQQRQKQYQNQKQQPQIPQQQKQPQVQQQELSQQQRQQLQQQQQATAVQGPQQPTPVRLPQDQPPQAIPRPSQPPQLPLLALQQQQQQQWQQQQQPRVPQQQQLQQHAQLYLQMAIFREPLIISPEQRSWSFGGPFVKSSPVTPRREPGGGRPTGVGEDSSPGWLGEGGGPKRLGPVGLELLKQASAEFINKKFPDHCIPSSYLHNRLLLFIHDSADSNLIRLVTPNTEILNSGSLIEIILSDGGLPSPQPKSPTALHQLVSIPPSPSAYQASMEGQLQQQQPPQGPQIAQQSAHYLNIHSYKSPHFCDVCGEMLWGLVRQGLKCEGCGLSYHKKCVYMIEKGCTNSRSWRLSGTSSICDNGTTFSRGESISGSVSSLVNESNPGSGSPNGQKRRSGFLSSTTVVVGGGSMGGGTAQGVGGSIQLPHSFQVHTFRTPAVCQHCHKMLTLFKQNFQCKDCRFKCHRDCAELVGNNCRGETKREAADGEETNFRDSMDETGSTDNLSDPIDLDNNGKNGLSMNEEGAELGNGNDDSASPKKIVRATSSNQIALQRLTFRNTRPPNQSNSVHEGWMSFYTSRDCTRKTHYWRLNSKSVTLFSDANSKRYYKEILLHNISNLTLASATPPPSLTGSITGHVFEMRVYDTIYFVGEDITDPSNPSGVSSRDRALAFHKALNEALVPLAEVTNVVRDKRIPAEEFNEKIEDISQLYDIYYNEVLGSGQFGIVYAAANKIRGHDVAVKVIDKLRFPNRQAVQLQNEVGILQNLHHPGVVNLEFMFESPTKIFVVMEKLKGDMLEMILSSAEGRLNERTTKYLVSQILLALRHLHSRSIVHCDLKPENVLLSSDALFPQVFKSGRMPFLSQVAGYCITTGQVKLCDFGFAKIIGDNSFRRSVVGTPAYVAPEVLRNGKYNKSLDMWSVGVIIYVSLSGTFPFNEDEDINDQIQNASFMFPQATWNHISDEAIELITKILQVQKYRRLSVDNSLNHIWLQDYQYWCDLRKLESQYGDYQCWCDLRKLESQYGVRYLTHESDDLRWETFRQHHDLPTWDIQGHRDVAVNIPMVVPSLDESRL